MMPFAQVTSAKDTMIFLCPYILIAKASDGNRTRDLFTTNEVRYRLCHASLS